MSRQPERGRMEGRVLFPNSSTSYPVLRVAFVDTTARDWWWSTQNEATEMTYLPVDENQYVSVTRLEAELESQKNKMATLEEVNSRLELKQSFHTKKISQFAEDKVEIDRELDRLRKKMSILELTNSHLEIQLTHQNNKIIYLEEVNGSQKNTISHLEHMNASLHVELKQHKSRTADLEQVTVDQLHKIMHIEKQLEDITIIRQEIENVQVEQINKIGCLEEILNNKEKDQDNQKDQIRQLEDQNEQSKWLDTDKTAHSQSNLDSKSSLKQLTQESNASSSFKSNKLKFTFWKSKSSKISKSNQATESLKIFEQINKIGVEEMQDNQKDQIRQLEKQNDSPVDQNKVSNKLDNELKIDSKSSLKPLEHEHISIKTHRESIASSTSKTNNFLKFWKSKSSKSSKCSESNQATEQLSNKVKQLETMMMCIDEAMKTQSFITHDVHMNIDLLKPELRSCLEEMQNTVTAEQNKNEMHWKQLTEGSQAQRKRLAEYWDYFCNLHTAVQSLNRRLEVVEQFVNRISLQEQLKQNVTFAEPSHNTKPTETGIHHVGKKQFVSPHNPAKSSDAETLEELDEQPSTSGAYTYVQSALKLKHLINNRKPSEALIHHVGKKMFVSPPDPAKSADTETLEELDERPSTSAV